MVTDLINEFRKANGKHPIHNWTNFENDHCMAHCLYLAWGEFRHTPECFLTGKAEAIAMCGFYGDFPASVKNAIAILADDPDHRSVLLDYNHMSYGVFTSNYQLYLTVRGWNG